MVIRGNTRGNGRQLAAYLLAKGENEHIHVLQVSGRYSPASQDVKEAFFDMDILSELSQSRKGLYHAQINPDLEASQTMDESKWFQAVDILEKELGLEGQPRVVVMHQKKGRLHAHIVWQRFDEQTQKIRSDSFSRLAQDRARKEMERVFEQKETPHRNKHRPELKAAMLDCWQQTRTGKEFINRVSETGYMVAAGSMRNPFMVVDENGRTYDLNRQIKGVSLKEIRERMKVVKLVGEKEAIEIMRRKKADGGAGGVSRAEEGQSTKANDGSQDTARKAAREFAQNRNQAVYGSDATGELARAFAKNRNESVYGVGDVSGKVEKPGNENKVGENRNELVKKKEEPMSDSDEIEKNAEQFEKELERLRKRNRTRGRGR